MDVITLANDELKRGIDRQVAEHNGRLVVTGLVSAASIASVVQVLAGTVASQGAAWMRWSAGLLCCLSTLASAAVWTWFETFDVDPAKRFEESVRQHETTAEWTEEVMARRMAAFRHNEQQLTNGARYFLFVAATATGVASVLLSLLVMTWP